MVHNTVGWLKNSFQKRFMFISFFFFRSRLHVICALVLVCCYLWALLSIYTSLVSSLSFFQSTLGFKQEAKSRNSVILPAIYSAGSPVSFFFFFHFILMYPREKTNFFFYMNNLMYWQHQLVCATKYEIPKERKREKKRTLIVIV